MHFEPSKELKQFIDECISSGWYQNQSEVLRTALRRMKREEDKRNRFLSRPNEETLSSFRETEEGKATSCTFDEFKKQMSELVDD